LRLLCGGTTYKMLRAPIMLTVFSSSRTNPIHDTRYTLHLIYCVQVSDIEYTFGYRRCADTKPRIFLHHSSLPHAPFVVKTEACWTW
jgi:hypothetical protein